MNIEEIAASHWSSPIAARALAERAMTALEALDPKSPPMGTTKLVRLLLPSANERQFKNLCSILGTARDMELLDGYFTRGKKGPTGHPLVHWKAETIEEF